MWRPSKCLGLMLILAGMVLAGCVSIRENRLADGSLAVEIEDNGWYIFGFLPIASGNPDGRWPNWFTDDIDPHKTMKVLNRIVEREKADTLGPIVTREMDENIFLIITRAAYHTSAIIPAKRKETETL